jgi:catechol 2,3-dioxygenase-like lactoylglutathione lyase family enzyme
VTPTLAYAILFAADLERSIRFYRDVLGIPLRFSTESYAEFETEGAKFAPPGASAPSTSRTLTAT